MISLEALHRNMLDDEAHGRVYIKNTGVRFYTTNICISHTNSHLIIDIEGFIKADCGDQLRKFFDLIDEPKLSFTMTYAYASPRIDIKCRAEHLSIEPFDSPEMKLLYGANK